MVAEEAALAQRLRHENMPPRLLKRKHVIAVRLRQRNRRKLLHWSASKNKKAKQKPVDVHKPEAKEAAAITAVQRRREEDNKAQAQDKAAEMRRQEEEERQRLAGRGRQGSW
ncbi:hypothetical protein MHU86_17957 [Fragilaria crotonensis]|nr:hypothetical protein MHU86_17957 [Fragilaria crotonensis]